MRFPRFPVHAALLAALIPLGAASAQGLAAFGPLDPNNGFPEWYQDSNGMSLGICLNNSGFCLQDGPVTLVDPNLPFPANYGGTFPEEFFYFIVDANLTTNNGGTALLTLRTEGSFTPEEVLPGNQTTFGRLRIRVDNLIQGETYVVTTPYGVFSLVAENSGVRGINFTIDVGRLAGDFTSTLSGPVGPFLTWDSDFPVVDAAGNQYIGDPNVLHTITGSPFGTNFFRIQGPSVGGPGVNSIETNLFSAMGLLSVVEPPPPAPVASFNSAPNSGTAPLNVSFTDTSVGDITSRLWSFGDGATSALQNPTHAYAAGTFTVSLTVTGPGGSNTATKTNLVAVTDPPVGNPLILANPLPGVAGVPNTYTVTGCTPGRTVGIFSGLQLGASVVNQGNCGGIPIGLARPFRLIGRSIASPGGIATIVATPPATAAGKTFHAQAVEPASCRTSNIASEVF